MRAAPSSTTMTVVHSFGSLDTAMCGTITIAKGLNVQVLGAARDGVTLRWRRRQGGSFCQAVALVPRALSIGGSAWWSS